MTQLNAEQIDARDRILDFAHSRADASFIMAGAAGTGKTTVVCDALTSLINGGLRVAVAAPTGKAAAVLNSKQKVAKATTIHGLIYKRPNNKVEQLLDMIEPLELLFQQGTANDIDKANLARLKLERDEAYQKSDMLSFSRREPEEIQDKYDAIVIDEASMVKPDIVRDLAAIGLPTIYLGDPNQLLPVKEPKFAVALRFPHVQLTQIMRQGEGSPILELAWDIVKHKGLPPKAQIKVPHISGTNPITILTQMGVDSQLIVHRNATRQNLCRTVRQHYHAAQLDPNHPFLPFPGERIMIDGNAPELGLMKGDIVKVTKVLSYEGVYLRPNEKSRDRFIASVECEDYTGHKRAIRMQVNDLMLAMNDKYALEPKFGSRTEMQNEDYKYVNYASRSALPVMYAYAITCHKAQGSEWNSVVVYNECGGPDKAPFLYTGVTRAKNQLMLAGVY
jgi:exodeoxyribonuclease V